MTDLVSDFEGLLRQALAPVEPPDDLAQRLESRLSQLTDRAAEELEGWELQSIRDPRTWAPAAAAAVVGTTAGAALVVLRVRATHRKRRAAASDPLDFVARTAEAMADEARKLLDR